jgi:uncharacterized membrane protein
VAKRPPRRPRLDTPVEARRGLVPRPHYDPEAFGRFSEAIARYLGTARFLVYLTLFVVVWLAWNTFLAPGLQFDPKQTNYTLLTLILSLQASYAAPLILLAQNRQADRDRVTQDEDREQSGRLKADVDYLTREVASMRQALGEVATRDFLRDQLRELTEEVIARTTEGAGEVLYDRQAREKREERERRAERKKRRAGRTEEQQPQGGGSLAEPFAGESESG